MYGSEIGLLTVVCITHPQTASPVPVKNPSKTRGTRIFHTIAIAAFEIPVSKLGTTAFPSIIRYVFANPILTGPSETAINMEKIVIAIRNKNKTRYFTVSTENFFCSINVFFLFTLVYKLVLL